MAVDQGISATGTQVANRAKNDGVTVPIKIVRELAVDGCEGIVEDSGSRREGGPASSGIARGALETGLTREALRNVPLAVGQDVDAKVSVASNDGQDRCVAIDASNHRWRIQR